MKLRTFGFRLNPPGPFWFEDLMFFVLDETRLLPARAADALSKVRALAAKAAMFARDLAAPRPAQSKAEVQPTAAATRRVEVEPLDEPETWYLATEPLLVVGPSSEAAVALHKAATEQLDALTYAIDRMRDDLRPIMIHARLPNESALHELPSQTALDANIEALLELSRRNAATRPKRRRSAA